MQGHNKQKDFFERTIKSGRLTHAYIFSGPEGIGKKLFAINVAKSLMCEKGSFFEECDCQPCRSIEMGAHPDFYIFSGDELNVENIRKIAETAAMTPLSGKWKVFILDKAEILSNIQIVAGNALLKSLEEPGANSIFFLITSRYDSVMPTIRSRTNRVNFSNLSFDETKITLEKIRPEEKFLDRIALQSGGSISKALKIMEGNVMTVCDFLAEKDYKRFAESFLGIKGKDDLKIATEFVYRNSLDRFKNSGGEYKFFLHGEYMLEILKRLQYNINVDLLKADFLSKTIEVYK